ncbi:MAG: FGGY family carbohydrate kinase, partial [Propioniciclava sp.]
METVLGIDVGTSSTKGVLTTLTGEVLASGVREHQVARPRTGHVEMDPDVWWEEFASLSRELTQAHPAAQVKAVGVSGMGPCLALVDGEYRP